MKTKLTLLATLILLAIVSAGCEGKKVFCIKGEGQSEAYTVELSEFNGIDLQVPADVTLSQGATQEVIITAQSNIVDNIQLDVVGGIWEIDYRDCVKKSESVKIDITLPVLTLAQISGSGTVHGLTEFTELDDLELKISGSGDMSLEANCNELTSSISGSGNMDLDMDCNEASTKITGSGNIDMDIIAATSISSRITGSGNLDYTGSTPTHSMEITGSGDLGSFDMTTEDTDVTISGSGGAEVMVNANLDVKISGSGDVYYKGLPGVNVDVSGSGKLINAN